MGDYLLYDQYIFIYNSLKFILESSLSEQLDTYKTIDFMEDCIPKYVYFQSLCHSADVLNKMRKYYHDEVERPFVFDDSFQISKYDLLKEDNNYVFMYEIYGIYERFYNDELKERRKKYEEEQKKFGRFWLMEGWFDKADRDLWLKAIDILSTITPLVREDIRDSLLLPNKEGEGEKKEDESHRVDTYSSLNNSISSSKSLHKDKKQAASMKKSKVKRTNSKRGRKHSGKERSTRSFRVKSLSRKGSLGQFNVKMPNNINVFRPPSVWNYPYKRLEKILIDNGEKKEIRQVDPTKSYKDHRVEDFLKLYKEIYSKSRLYLMEKGDEWEYFFTKTLNSLQIEYETSKQIKAREELEKQIQEKKREEEEKAEKLNAAISQDLAKTNILDDEKKKVEEMRGKIGLKSEAPDKNKSKKRVTSGTKKEEPKKEEKPKKEEEKKVAEEKKAPESGKRRSTARVPTAKKAKK